MSIIPVITIDGPSGTGKGTLSRLIANRLGWYNLDSGALYRTLAYAAMEQGISLDDLTALQDLVSTLNVQFVSDAAATKILLAGSEIVVSGEEYGRAASQLASHALVRSSLLAWQRDFLKPPGLVADGRDMGTVVFPSALLKIYLNATPEVRIKRRFKQLKEQGINASLVSISVAIRQRDEKDISRLDSPLKPATDAVLIDTTALDIVTTMTEIWGYVEDIFPDLLES